MKKYIKNMLLFAAAFFALGFLSSCDSDDDDSGSGVGEIKSAPSAVGDIVLTDGTILSAGSTLTDEQKESAVAVIFYIGTSDSDILGKRVLGVGLKNYAGQWAKLYTTGVSLEFSDIEVVPSATGEGSASTATFTGDIDGSDNWSIIQRDDPDGSANAATNYPAWNWINTYAEKNGLSETNFKDGWYMPSLPELCVLFRQITAVNNSLIAADGMSLGNRWYWSSSSEVSHKDKWRVKFDKNEIERFDTNTTNSLCAIRSFSN